MADKGKCVVVLNKFDHDNKYKDLLKDKKVYKPVGCNPISGYKKKVTEYTTTNTTEGTIDLNLKRKLDPSEPAVHAFYGLPKIRKPDPIHVRFALCLNSFGQEALRSYHLCKLRTFKKKLLLPDLKFGRI